MECTKCGKKTDSAKGLGIAEAPYLLQLVLKRFVFNYSTMQREKLNDPVTYPLFLDLNPFVGTTKRSTASGEGGGDCYAGLTPFDTLPAEGSASSGGGGGEGSGGSSGGGGGGGSGSGAAAAERPKLKTREEALAWAATAGPHVYELYSVLIHSGGAAGGHYYAYIKDMDENQWHNFNDSSVNDISVSTVLGAAGGLVQQSSSYYFGYPNAYNNSYTKPSYSAANAYMLMYRKVLPTATVEVATREMAAAAAASRARGASVDTPPSAAAAAAAVAPSSSSSSSSSSTPQSGGGCGGGDAPLPSSAADSTSAATPSTPASATPATLFLPRSLPSNDEVPPYARDAAALEAEAQAREAAEAEAKRADWMNNITINVYYRGELKTVPGKKTDSVGVITERAWRQFGFDTNPFDGIWGVQEDEFKDKIKAAEAVAMYKEQTEEMLAAVSGGGRGEDGSGSPRLGTEQFLPLDCFRLREYDATTYVVTEPWTFDPPPLRRCCRHHLHGGRRRCCESRGGALERWQRVYCAGKGGHCCLQGACCGDAPLLLPPLVPLHPRLTQFQSGFVCAQRGNGQAGAHPSWLGASGPTACRGGRRGGALVPPDPKRKAAAAVAG